MDKKYQELIQRIEKNSQVVKSLENDLKTAKLELETDKELLKKHENVLEQEKIMTEQLKQKVNARVQIDAKAVIKEKNLRLKRAHNQLVENEEEERAKIQ